MAQTMLRRVLVSQSRAGVASVRLNCRQLSVTPHPCLRELKWSWDGLPRRIATETSNRNGSNRLSVQLHKIGKRRLSSNQLAATQYESSMSCKEEEKEDVQSLSSDSLPAVPRSPKTEHTKNAVDTAESGQAVTLKPVPIDALHRGTKDTIVEEHISASGSVQEHPLDETTEPDETVTAEPVPDADEGTQMKATINEGDQEEHKKSAHEIHIVSGHLARAVKGGDFDTAMEMFRKSVELDIPLRSELLLDLIDLVTPSRLEYAFDVLRRHEGTASRMNQPLEVQAYLKVCDAVGTVRNGIPPGMLRSIVSYLTNRIKSLDEVTYQHVCLPRLVHSLVKQRSATVGRMAGPIFEHMSNRKFPIDADLFEKILSQSRYGRQDELPYDRVMGGLVWVEEHKPKPWVVLNALQNMYPFRDSLSTSSMLRSILKLQRSVDSADGHDYRVDIGTLEQIAASGAKRGTSKLVLQVWDFMEALDYRPTESMYESMIQTFVLSFRQDHNAFAVLAEMEENGFVPSRALVRSISRPIGSSMGRVDNAYYILTNRTPGTQITTASLNCILSACAEGGLVDRAFATFDDFSTYGIEPNADTFSFLLESLAVDVSTTVPIKVERPPSSSGTGRDEGPDDSAQMYWVESQLEAADAVLDMMVEMDVATTRHVLHQFVRILCLANELDRARRVLEDAREGRESVSDETFALVATHYAQGGNFDMARQVAGYVPCNAYLLKRIDKLEKRRQ